MLRSTTLLLSLVGLTLAASTVACSGADAKNSDVDTSRLAVQQKDGKPTGDGKTCSWGGIGTVTVTPPVAPKPDVDPPSGGSSGGCDGNGNCWSYNADGEPTPIAKSPASSTSSSSGSSGTMSSSSGGSSGSSGGCSTDEKGNRTCWTYPSEPEPTPKPEPTPTPAPVPETHNLGDWFPSLDGCNRCTCTNIGIMCTVQICDAPPPPPSKGCDVDGKLFASGDQVPSGDCNSCSCGPDGQIACTTMACVDPSPPPPVSAKPLPTKK